MATKNEIHQKAMAEFDAIQSAVRDERLQCLKDRRFYSISGAQWEGPLSEQFENKPKLEVNKIHLSVIRIINEYRNNRITVNFVGKDNLGADQLADTCGGLYRAAEQDSVAVEAYDNAFEEAVGGGFGAWRLRAEYEDESDEDDDRQQINIEPIFDADSSVFFDLQSKRQDKKDANHCFVLTAMTPEAYKEEYDEDPATFPKSIHDHEFDWATQDAIFVAEYFKVEKKKEQVVVFTHLSGENEKIMAADLTEEKEAELLALGASETRRKRVVRRRVRKYILSGSKILENCGYIAGSEIPVIPVYGKRWYVDNIERCMGHVRLSKDVQRLKNMQLSRLAEISALSTISKPILFPEQMSGHQVMWAEDNLKNFPYLLINPLTQVDGSEMPVGPVAYTKPPEIPQAMAALLQITEQDMQDILGNQQNGEQLMGNVSTQTAELVQGRLDMQTYIYMSNMSRAMRRCGEVWLSMAKDIFVEEGRNLKSTNDQGENEFIQVARQSIDGEGNIVIENDLSSAKFDVVSEVGPSSSTKKSAVVRSLMGIIQATDDPATKDILTSMAIMNSEGEGIQDVKDFFRKKLLRMGALKPSKEEAQQLQAEAQNQEPSAQDKALEAMAMESEAKAVKTQADTLQSQAKTDNIRAETIQTLTETDIKEQKQAMEIIDKMGPRVTPPEFPGFELE
jgi:hypothetical protein